jgi:hypothetical protein
MSSKSKKHAVKGGLSIPHLDGLSAIPPGLLYPHQADGVAFLLSKKRALLADDMGLGKTRQAVVALQAAVREGVVLVVCPASLKLNWKREILMVDPTKQAKIPKHFNNLKIQGGCTYKWTYKGIAENGRQRARCFQRSRGTWGANSRTDAPPSFPLLRRRSDATRRSRYRQRARRPRGGPAARPERRL